MADTEDARSAQRSGSRIRRLSQPQGARARRRGGRAQRRPLPRHHHEHHDVRARDACRSRSSARSTPRRRRSAASGVRADVVVEGARTSSASITTRACRSRPRAATSRPAATTSGSGIDRAEDQRRGLRLRGAHDCARKRLKNAQPEFKDETQVTITANPGIQYKTVIDVMDALRTDGDGGALPRRPLRSGCDERRHAAADRTAAGRSAAARRAGAAEAGQRRPLQGGAPQGDPRNAREPEIDFLNITAMLDLMTIILVFLLKSLCASSASIPQSKDLDLARRA